ncbi:hypothetical protein QCA50_008221 [Cerrena zonata]|uniref:Uncharacterized protein n=1 Tax=Cerrena zonata TaxID=2478898 RepID=A0AAW0GEZ4_9APHY
MSTIRCKGLSFTSYIVDIICLFSYAIFNCLRIWSICQHQWVPTLLVFTLGMFDPAINIYAYSINFLGSYLAVPSGPLAGCWVESDTISYIYCWTISVAADAAVLGFTLWKTVYIIKMDKAVRVSSKLTTTLAYNGSIQFGILLIVNILAVILDVLSVATDGEGAKASVFIYMQNVITSIVLSHFILSLRSIYHTTNNFTHPPSKNSSVLFASAIEGNMGATLSASWADVEESEDTQYSEYPFSIGLADSKEFIERDNIEEVSEVSPPDTIDISEEPSTHGVISVVHRAGV